MTVLPKAPVILPAVLAGRANGEIPDDLLFVVDQGARFVRPAAIAVVAMLAAIQADGIPLGVMEGYRSINSQRTLFLARYTTSYRLGAERKKWNGTTYYKRYGVATAATPGSSNHGWGLAGDFALWQSEKWVSISGTAVNWLIVNAERYGFSGELDSEVWHWRWVLGDGLPPALVGGQPLPIPTLPPGPLPPPLPPPVLLPPPTPTPPVMANGIEEDDMRIIIPINGADESWARFAENGSTVEWLAGPRSEFFRSQGRQVVAMPWSDLKNYRLVGPVPAGDKPGWDWRPEYFAS